MHQFELARAISVSEEGMQDIQVGRKGIAIVRLAKIMVALDMLLEEMIGKE